ncbi:MAG: hypothetical protein IJM10_06120 [Clostridia bacterium]|nr:hypothetical protein [Clostridia bacterium]
MKKTLKKTIALFLCAVLLACGPFTIAFAEDEKPFYLVLGDSIGYGSGLKNSREACYGKIVADTNGYDYANDAIPGHTTQNLLNRLNEEGVAGHIKQADIISITIGGNNFLLGNIAKVLFDVIVMDDTASAEKIIDGFYADFCKIIEKIRSLNPDAVILMQTLYNPQTKYIGEAYQTAIDLLNNAIKRYASEHKGEIEIVDVASALTDSEKDFAADRIHPSVAGNEKIAVKVLEKLVELGLGKTAEPVITTPGIDIELPASFSGGMAFFGEILHFLAGVRSAFMSILGVFNFA